MASQSLCVLIEVGIGVRDWGLEKIEYKRRGTQI